VDTPTRTYLDLVAVPVGGRAWSPDEDGWPLLAQWERATSTHSAIRTLSPFAPGDVLPPEQIVSFLPRAALGRNISITDAPCSACTPADATKAIQCALDTAGQLASEDSPVNVIVPEGNWTFSAVLEVRGPARIHLA
jgi:hypothetical protein